jgi:DUF1680 family protein
MKKRTLLSLMGWILLSTLSVSAAVNDDALTKRWTTEKKHSLQPEVLHKVLWKDVEITDTFWRSRQEAIVKAGIPHVLNICENQKPYLQNLVNAGKKNRGEAHEGHKGYFWDDYFVHRCVQDMAYALSLDPMGDPEMVARQKEYHAKLEEWIPIYQAAQEKDGYFDAYFTLTGEPRLKSLKKKHEFFLMGAMIEAATAHYRATDGKDSRLLDVAVKCADYLCLAVSPEGVKVASGHAGIELALVELGELIDARDGPGSGAKYLELTTRLVDAKGDHQGRYDDATWGAYSQDHLPLIKQEHAVGHAVRANYLYTAAADLARLTGNDAYRPALDRIWDSAINRRMFVTGGMGLHGHEAYKEDYNLPTAQAYQESCASAGNITWQNRMMLLTGDAKYADVLERALYNALPAGISLKGDRFFYTNPLESKGAERWGWHGCACCPGNIMQMMLRVGDYVYAAAGDEIYLNLFVDSRANLTLDDQQVEIIQKTDYPWDGRVAVTVNPQETGNFKIKVRIPGWAQNQPVPGDLYRFLKVDGSTVSIEVNGQPVDLNIEKGYVVIDREWRKGDQVSVDMPMPVRQLEGHDAIKLVGGKTAFQRGPIVYCAEGADNDGHAFSLWAPDDMVLEAKQRDDLPGKPVALMGKARSAVRNKDGSVASMDTDLTLIPYCIWSNRGLNEMRVWLPRAEAGADPTTAPTLASLSRATASHHYKPEHIHALNDLVEPASSGDHDIPRFTWWDHKGGTEYVQYDFKEPTEVSSMEVYWFDDTGRGACRVPASWRLLSLQGGKWAPVKTSAAYGLEKDRYNRVDFEPTEADALRIEVKLQPGFSGGILEWRVN